MKYIKRFSFVCPSDTFGPQVNALYFDAFIFYSSINLLVLYTWVYDSRYRSLPFPVFQFLLCGFLFIGTQVGAAVKSLSCRSRLISHSFGRLESFLTNTLHLPSLLMCRSNDFAYLTLDFSDFLFLYCIQWLSPLVLADILRLGGDCNSNSQVDQHCVIFTGLSLDVGLSWTVKCQT